MINIPSSCRPLTAIALSLAIQQSQAAITGIDSVALGAGDTLSTATVGGVAYPGGVIATSCEDNRANSFSFDSNAFLTAGDPAPTGTATNSADANQGKTFDDSVLTGVAGSANASQAGGGLVLRWNASNGITDNDADPDFFVFEDGGNDNVGVHAILADGTLGQGVALSGWTTVSTSGVLSTNGATTLTGRTVSGVAFHFTDLLDAAGANLVNGAIIQGIVIGDTIAADFYEVYAHVDSAVVDPQLTLSGGSPDSDLTFPATFSTGSDLTKVLVYEVSSASGTASVDIDALTITDDPDHPTDAFTVSSVPSAPTTLNDGESITITVTADGSTGGTFNGSLLIDTTSTGGNAGPDDNNVTLAASSAFYASGTKLNPNPFMDDNLANWGGFSSASQPGIAPGSTGMARVKGQGDAAANAPDSHYQSSIPAGASDFEFTAYFTPIDIANFSDYVDPGVPSTIPDGDFLDRTFQLVIFDSTDDLPTTGAYGDDQSDHSLINLTYFPDGTSDDPGVADFYVFNGNSWDGTGIGAIAGSVDNDTDGDASNGVGDGQLDPSIDPLDVVNAYRLTLTGTDFGGVSPSYTITVTKVSGPDTFTTASSASLSSFENAGGTPAAYAFTTADLSLATNPDSGFRPTFWVDDVCFFGGSAPDPNLVLLGDTSPTISVFDPATSDIGTLNVRNDGVSALNVSSISGAANGISVTSANAFNLAANALEAVEITFDATAVTPDTAGTAELTINSNDPLDPAVVIPVEGGASSLSQLIANWDFEVPGVSTDNTFAIWEEGGTVSNVVAVPGLGAGSTTAAYVNRDGGFSEITHELGMEVNNFTSEFDFAVKDTTDRALTVLHFAAGSASHVNIRYQGGVWSAFDGAWQPLANLPAITASEDNNGNGSLDDPGDVKEIYTLRLTGTGWGTATPTFGVELFNAAGSSLGSDTGLSFFQNSLPVGGLGSFTATCEFGTNPGWWIDDVAISGTVSSDTGVAIDSVSGGPGSFTINWTTDPGGASVRVLLSTDGMQTFNEIDTGNTTGTFTAAGADAPAGRAFYRVETE
ncbi:beta strand repeat-containing protein [Haloferula sp.]|uniref:beta strand repeat-containing protein n=1 Tax=Haloferula sp. TaxID=2497595 RepID=UPI0032A05390